MKIDYYVKKCKNYLKNPKVFENFADIRSIKGRF